MWNAMGLSRRLWPLVSVSMIFLLCFWGHNLFSFGRMIHEYSLLCVDDGKNKSTIQKAIFIRPYNSTMIVAMAKRVEFWPARLLVYNDTTNTFQVYSIGSRNKPKVLRNLAFSVRAPAILSVLIPAILQLNVTRSFQILFSDADFSYNDCLSFEHCEDASSSFAPLLQFGSTLKNTSSVLPNVLPYPTEPYIECLSEWLANSTMETCTRWDLPRDPGILYSDLKSKPGVIYRGSNTPFLNCLNQSYFRGFFSVPTLPFRPRTFLTLLSSSEEANHSTTSWLDAAYGRGRGGHFMSPDEMAYYKYQLDVGGAGGTTWTGTINKLYMPGLLFHHETPAMDWFHPDMEAWKHYVPVRTDLSDLKQKYDWAEAHPKEAAQIAQRGTQFAMNMLQRHELERQYELYFGTKASQLGHLVEACAHDDILRMETTMVDFYMKQGLAVISIGNCTRSYCEIVGRGNKLVRRSHSSR